MSEKPISPLRRRMIEDMTVRNFVEKTHNDYIRHVRTFTAFLGRAPDTAAPEDLRLFQLHQTQTGVGASGINGSVAALRFFFTVTLDRPEMARHLTFVREPRKIPVILSLEEIARLLEAAPGPKYKAALSAAYGAGLRVSEVVALKVSDIDSERMLLHIEQGKGRKDRFAMLSPRLLELLRDWYRIARPALWLFPGRDPWNAKSPRFAPVSGDGRRTYHDARTMHSAKLSQAEQRMCWRKLIDKYLKALTPDLTLSPDLKKLLRESEKELEE